MLSFLSLSLFGRMCLLHNFNTGFSGTRKRRVCDSTVRPHYVTAWCPIQSRGLINNMFVDDTNKVIYCFIPKVACTTFKALMISSTAGLPINEVVFNYNIKVNRMHHVWKRLGVRTLSSYNTTEMTHRLNTYFKFMAVRHPFDRLVSVWLEKIEFADDDDIVSVSNLTKEHYQRFQKFVNDVAAGERSDHWDPQSYQCDPCRTKYDSIVKLETAKEDFPLILSKLKAPDGQPNSMPTVHVKSSVSPSEKLDTLTKFYSSVNSSVIEKLLEIYRNDFSLFGYTWNVKTAKAGCGYHSIPSGTATEGCCWIKMQLTDMTPTL